MTQLNMSEAEVRALPVSVPLVLAGRAFGTGAGKSRELARSGEFPCRVIKVGTRYRVPKSAILEALGLDRTGAAADTDTRQTTAEGPDDDHHTRRLRAIGS